MRSAAPSQRRRGGLRPSIGTRASAADPQHELERCHGGPWRSRAIQLAFDRRLREWMTLLRPPGESQLVEWDQPGFGQVLLGSITGEVRTSVATRASNQDGRGGQRLCLPKGPRSGRRSVPRVPRGWADHGAIPGWTTIPVDPATDRRRVADGPAKPR
jgi:hypothetical protein